MTTTATQAALDAMTPYQQLQVFDDITGVQIRLRPFEELVKMKISDGGCIALIDGINYTERSREYRVTGRYKRMISVTVTLGVREDILEDMDFEPFVIKKFEFARTAEVQKERRAWERLCHRPAGDRDSHTRLAQGYVGSAPKGAIR